MSVRARSLLVIGCIAISLLATTQAQAGPSKSKLTVAGFNCFKDSNQDYFLLSFNMDNGYLKNPPYTTGNYRYTAETGRLNFKTGPLEAFFAKVTKSGFTDGLDMVIKRDSTKTKWAHCQNYTTGY